MKIGFDARLINETGVGRYIRNLLPLLIGKNKRNSWVVTVRGSERSILEESISPFIGQVKIIEVNARWHSFYEQLVIPFTFYKEGVDILHIPYINVPFFYFKRMVVTIHDLTVLTNKTGRASTLNPLFYSIKRLGYNFALKKALKSEFIFTVSYSVKNEILEKFPKIKSEKIIVTYNGLSALNKSRNIKLKKTINNYKPYFFYVGNAHPHKNLEFMVLTLDKFFQKFSGYKMIISGRNDYFMRRIFSIINKRKTKDNFILVENPSDSDLYDYYKNSELVILPSLKEGFGMQILESMQTESLIVASNISAYKEVGNNLCTYFDPTSKRSFVLALHRTLKISKKEREDLFKRYRVHLKKFSWNDNAKQVLNTYVDNKSPRNKTLMISPGNESN